VLELAVHHYIAVPVKVVESLLKVLMRQEYRFKLQPLVKDLFAVR
jgi:hypothetical protein